MIGIDSISLYRVAGRSPCRRAPLLSQNRQQIMRGIAHQPDRDAAGNPYLVGALDDDQLWS
ncbi:MAG TPA: hypothetical protein VJR58_31105 [Vineibacter sp.]|nr:hypothetical protein [Vineibacter sp.]